MAQETVTRSAVEDVKAQSGHLRGELAAELAAAADSFSSESQTLLKFHGVYQQDDRDQRRALTQAKQSLAYSCMVRTSVPGGVLSADQWLALDTVAGELGDGTLRVTTRQGIQFHFVAKHDLRSLIGGLNRHLVTTKGACGDIVRNVVACPAPHADRRQHELLHAAQALAQRFRPTTKAYYELWLDGDKAMTVSPADVATEHEPVYGETYLPRKFKIGLAYPGDNCIDVYSQDVGIVPQERRGADGYAVLAGGGLGMAHARPDDTYPRLASPIAWVPADGLGDVVEAIVTTQRDFGDRSDRHRARLKYTIDERGLDWFRGELAQRVGDKLPLAEPLPHWHNSDEHLGWFEEPGGTWSRGIHVDSGRVADRNGVELRTALRELVARHGPEVRLTARQDVILSGLHAGAQADVDATLARHGVVAPESLRPVRRLLMACPALPTCGQALSEAERVGPEVADTVQDVLDRAGLGDLDLRVNITGCPNGCARPYTAELGIVGRTKTGYDVYVGGAVGGDRLAERVATGVKLADLATVLEPLVTRFVAERDAGEGFGDWTHRAGVAADGTLLAAVPIRRRAERASPAA